MEIETIKEYSPVLEFVQELKTFSVDRIEHYKKKILNIKKCSIGQLSDVIPKQV